MGRRSYLRLCVRETIATSARQYYCYQEGGHHSGDDGSGIKNQACKSAFLYNEALQPWQRKQIFDEWAAYSQNLEGSKPEDKVPDGTLCAAGKNNDGTQNFTGMDQPSPYWHVSTVTVKDGKATLTYQAKQVHEPSTWTVFLAKTDFDASKDILKWENLTPLDVSNIVVPPESKTNKNARYEGVYTLDVKIPDDRVNDQQTLLYVQWERQEGPHETFFSCSDVKFIKAKS
jgi:chitin-binding protein